MTEKTAVFITPEQFHQFLREQDVETFLSLDKDEAFLAECTLLNHWSSELSEPITVLDLTTFVAYQTPMHNPTSVQVEIEYDHGKEIILMCYIPDRALPGRHHLDIFLNAQLVYSRSADQDPATEWNINCMADDLTDEQGNFIFSGEPTKI